MTQKTVFNRKANIDFTKQPMFFGEDQNTQRYDTFKYPALDKLNQTMLGYFWRPEEISLQKDRADFQNFRPEQKHIFTSNLKYQTLLDSVQGRGPSLAFLPYVSIPELEGCIITWDFFETIHSRSYTYIMKNIYADPSEVFDTILHDQEIVKRAISVTENYDQFYKIAQDYFVKGKGDIKEVKKALYLAMVNVNILEGLRFYVSFACTFAFAERELMEGNSKIIRLIARDENLHLTSTQHILNLWQKGKDDPEMAEIAEELKDEAKDIFLKAVEQEKQWAGYLFAQGSMIGLNEEILCQYVEYIANHRMSAIGMGQPFDVTSNPLPWMNNYLNSDNVQVAPQESEISSYLVGQIDSEVNADDFGDFDL